jgi:hypothetical protein
MTLPSSAAATGAMTGVPCWRESPQVVQLRWNISLMLLSGALCGCANVPVSSPQLDARTLCQQQAQASASAPEASDTQKYFDQCMIAKSKEKSKAD